jgi:hypothetical protein
MQAKSLCSEKYAPLSPFPFLFFGYNNNNNNNNNNVVVALVIGVSSPLLTVELPMYFAEEKPEITISSMLDGLNPAQSDVTIGSPKRKVVVLKGYEAKWNDEEIFKKIMLVTFFISLFHTHFNDDHDNNNK